MFRGQYEHNMDAKGRVSLPSRFKDVLSEKFSSDVFIITASLDKCLVGYPIKEWERLEEKILALPTFDKAAVALKRLILAPAIECTLDKQGRFLVPPLLRRHAQLDKEEKEITFTGYINHFEIWSTPVWLDMMESLKSESNLQDMKEMIKALGI